MTESRDIGSFFTSKGSCYYLLIIILSLTVIAEPIVIRSFLVSVVSEGYSINLATLSFTETVD